jgi:prepilin-type processing-associated H-X9-DG protein
MKEAIEIIVVYENPQFCKDGVNVGFLDGHVMFMKPAEFKKVIEETYKRLNKPMPEIKFWK